MRVVVERGNLKAGQRIQLDEAEIQHFLRRLELSDRIIGRVTAEDVRDPLSNEIIVQSRTADRIIYARAMGPMQFLPGTWARYAADGDRDGKANVQNLFDSTLAAARYLCSGGLNLRDQSQVMAAILRYNNSMAYVANVLAWSAAYSTGVTPSPADLPRIH